MNGAKTTPGSTGSQQAPAPRSASRSREIMGRVWASPTGKISLVMIAALVLIACLADQLVTHNPTAQVLGQTNQPPSWMGGEGGHLLGSDPLGRDVFSRILVGLRLSLLIGFLTATATALIGLTLGLLAGYYERFVGGFLMRVADIQFAVPFAAVGIALAAFAGPSVVLLMAVLAFWGWTNYARTIVSLVGRTKRLDFVTAARTTGASPVRVLVRHITPNVLGPVIILWSTSVGTLILVESSLSLLGLGVQPPGFSLGSMLADAQKTLRLSWWAAVFPGMGITLVVIAFNLLGDALRDAFNPALGSMSEHDPELT
ncbi:ABC transporter permease [Nocardiopsis alkaliphila]|uniref:ABC transporter permease n=1 Tax=Nocardiopsis alkaliphila TaxID=225762 RepID=UPI000364FA10|nr:ABC transporter permease [Nocardiopsis alkaliphila]